MCAYHLRHPTKSRQTKRNSGLTQRSIKQIHRVDGRWDAWYRLVGLIENGLESDAVALQQTLMQKSLKEKFRVKTNTAEEVNLRCVHIQRQPGDLTHDDSSRL